MDIATIGGLILGVAMVAMGIIIGGVGVGIYIDIPSILIVLGGSFAGLMVSNPLPRILGVMKYVRHAIQVPNYEVEKTITTLVNFSERARREGLLALEDDIEEVEDEFLKNGIQLVVDGTDPELIKSILYNDVGQLEERHAVGIKIFDDWGALTPAFGMIGTLIGLIAMLANLDDPDAIGSGMATALITTLYGSFLANLLFIPFKNKLEDRDRAERLSRDIMIEGILSIQAGDNPNILKYKLISFLEPAKRKEMLDVMMQE
ncbi:motility protein A [Sediminispirochaeta smaragdinae]|jgi:chemotaxis protein MotA|uniref:MotA/TolQ/ExbB proton channel n=1 Tax=Sediminispirochaeta smaragdinae (strain DSM 11293 / JCM 15392 / SEBR 4228) TaxID=573413 RepID=E1R5T4_SEDSS|nr:motility protein A [Sediminispirochaeta smaragdinae]ADK80699.1 MotA/TolQ/ExbB proton channel [Sediminispirochaeta smaragdinae DSM 11293]